MANYEIEMQNALADLRAAGVLWGVKAEFEAEGSRFFDVLRLSKVARSVGTHLAVKIGGCEAVRDLLELRDVGVDSIIAPMIESAYALSKFDQAIDRVFGSAESKPDFFANFETAQAAASFDEILSGLNESRNVSGIVFGRVDFSISSGLSRDDINSSTVFGTASRLAEALKHSGKLLLVGGGVSPDSVTFLSNLAEVKLDRFETRKVVFNARAALDASNLDELILTAVRFELAWLRSKRESASQVSTEDDQRIEMLEARWLG